MIATLKRRSEFLRVRGGARWSTPGFLIETRVRPGGEGEPRFGFTVTKKLGNAVVRNRIRRRLREAIRLSAPACAKAGHDYVVVARIAAADRDFAELISDFETAFSRLQRPARASGPRDTRPPGAG